MSNFISYWDLLNDRHKFRKSAGLNSTDFNKYDTPGHKYFKIFFYFDNMDVDGENMDNGLLAPTWLEPVENLSDKTYYMYNSAWSYLKMNAEDERANQVEEFVTLLSNISSESPWYFSEISGLDAAMERKLVMADSFAIESTRPKITIKCLPDSFDDRIGTLLDLYRSVVWDWKTKREVLPSNLRKFDMGIFIFETANAPFHVRKEEGKGQTMDNFDQTSTSFISLGNHENKTSYKYIELHNCEFDYGSTKNLYSSLNNKDGWQTEYNIDIHFDDCYESRHNEFMMKELGDIIIKETQQQSNNAQTAMDWVYPGSVTSSDNTNFVGNESWYTDKVVTKSDKYRGTATYKTLEETNLGDKEHPNAKGRVKYGQSYRDGEDYGAIYGKEKEKTNLIGQRLPEYPKPPAFTKGGFLTNMVDQLVSTGAAKLNSLLKKAVLGNLYTFSLTRIGNQLKSLASGDILSTVRYANEYIRDANGRHQASFEASRLFPETKPYQMEGIPDDKDLFVKPNVQQGTLSPSFFSEPNAPIAHKQAELFEKPSSPTTHKVTQLYQKKKIKPKVKYIGNLYEGNTLANNL